MPDTATSDDADIAFAGLAGQAKLLAAGELSSRELTELSLRRIAAAQPTLNAFRVVCEERALRDAAAADARLRAGESGPLLGVPIAIKDDVDLAGETTPFGCAGEHEPATEDAEVVARLRAAGAVIVGKTNAPEVGQWPFCESPAFGATRNPWSLRHTPGGSSGGSAAAVAAGLVAAAIGSDGAGSIRIPAAWSGLVGVKPQRGRISTWPDPEAFNGLTVHGPLTRTVEDAAILLDALRGNRPGDLHTPPPPPVPFSEAARQPPRRLRIAVSYATPFGVPDKVDEEIEAAIERTAEELAGFGHELVRADPDYGLVGAALVPRGTAGLDAWLRERRVDRSQLERRTVVHARLGRLLSGLPMRAARAAEPLLRRRIGRIFRRADVVLTPATAKPPFPIGALDGRGFWATGTIMEAACPFAFPWNVTGWPAISVPCGFTRSGLPIGAQLLGPENGEGILLGLAADLEASQRWSERRPPYWPTAR